MCHCQLGCGKQYSAWIVFHWNAAIVSVKVICSGFLPLKQFSVFALFKENTWFFALLFRVVTWAGWFCFKGTLLLLALVSSLLGFKAHCYENSQTHHHHNRETRAIKQNKRQRHCFGPSWWWYIFWDRIRNKTFSKLPRLYFFSFSLEILLWRSTKSRPFKFTVSFRCLWVQWT